MPEEYNATPYHPIVELMIFENTLRSFAQPHTITSEQLESAQIIEAIIIQTRAILIAFFLQNHRLLPLESSESSSAV